MLATVTTPTVRVTMLRLPATPCRLRGMLPMTKSMLATWKSPVPHPWAKRAAARAGAPASTGRAAIAARAAPSRARPAAPSRKAPVKRSRRPAAGEAAIIPRGETARKSPAVEAGASMTCTR